MYFIRILRTNTNHDVAVTDHTLPHTHPHCLSGQHQILSVHTNHPPWPCQDCLRVI